MTRGWMVASLVAALLPGAMAAAAPARREAVRAALRAPDSAPRTAAEWQRLGDDVDVYLVEAAADGKLAYGARQKALAALGAVKGERAKEFLHGFVTTSGVAAPLLSSAVQAYARGFGSEDPVEAQRLGAALLAHPDWMVRRGAVQALGTLGTVQAKATLRDHESRETHAAVRAALRAALEDGARRK